MKTEPRVVRQVQAGNGRPAVVLEAGLNIPRHRPGIVADAILAVAAQARVSR
jgi:hypothetical protein